MPVVVAMLVMLSLLWGIAFVGIKELLQWLSPGSLTVLRFLIADVALAILALAWSGARPAMPRDERPRLIALAVLGIPGYHLAISWGETRTGAGIAALVVGTAPVMVALLSAVVLRERIGAVRAAGIAFAFAGVALLAFTATPAQGDPATEPLGVLILAASPASWAIYSVLARPLLARMTAMQLTATVFLLGSVFLLPFVRAETIREAQDLPLAGWLWLALLGLGSSVAGYVIFNWALGKMEASRVSVFLYMVPIAAIVGAWLIRGEPVTGWVALCAALVIGGVTMAQRGGASRSSDAPRAPHPKKTSATSSSS